MARAAVHHVGWLVACAAPDGAKAVGISPTAPLPSRGTCTSATHLTVVGVLVHTTSSW